MTNLPPDTRCTSLFPVLGNHSRPRCDRQPHTDRIHIADVDGTPFAWSDPDDGALLAWERATLAAVRDIHDHTAPTTVEQRYADLEDAAAAFVAHLRARPGGTDRQLTPCVRALINAYDALHQEVPA